MPVKLSTMAALAGMLLFGAVPALADVPSDDEPGWIAQLDDPQLIEAGRQRFNQACTYCHGKEGAGGKTRSFKGRSDLNASAVFEVISNGRKRGANIMPPWKNSLTEAQIRELVAYILSLGRAPEGN